LFQPTDTSTSVPVAIVSEKFAHRYFKQENPLGKQVKFGRSAFDERPWLTIVGIAGQVKHRTIIEDPFALPESGNLSSVVATRETQRGTHRADRKGPCFDHGRVAQENSGDGS
jgi:hypothetical protein